MKHSLVMIALTGLLLTVGTGCEKSCDEWFEKDGKDCVEMRQKFFGTYVGTFSANGQTQNIQTTLSTNGNVQRITWDNSQYLELSG